jgi:DNA gyrase/topoisomerase IV subunit A
LRDLEEKLIKIIARALTNIGKCDIIALQSRKEKNMTENKGKFVCGICGKTVNGLDEYLEHIKACGDKLRAQEDAEKEKKRLEEMNKELSKIKAAKEYYEDLMKNFKKVYPKEYDMNFGANPNKDDSSKTSKDKKNPKVKVMSAEEFFRDEDEGIRVLAKILGII